jgi:predicted RND superfamily exporter protein
MHAKNLVRQEMNMKHGVGFLAVLALFGVLILLFILLYRRLYARKPQAGLQALGVSLAWLGGLLAFTLDFVELASGLAFLGFVIGIFGLFLHTRPARESEPQWLDLPVRQGAASHSCFFAVLGRNRLGRWSWSD